MVLYYDVFRHPLTEGELSRLCGFETTAAVDALAAASKVERVGRWVAAVGHTAHAERRAERTEAAERRWPAARLAGRLLAALPWVRGVLVTGGLSKQSTDAEGDVDFLLLIEPGSVWITKSALQLFRRSLPAPARELFCTNYLLATDQLRIEDQSLFTAMELATAVPLHGAESCVALLDANRDWAHTYVPGFDWSIARAANAPTHRPPAASRLVESLMRRAGPGVEQAALTTWDHYWNRKYDWLDERTRGKRFRRTAGAATNHLHDFQGWVLDEYRLRCARAGIAA